MLSLSNRSSLRNSGSLQTQQQFRKCKAVYAKKSKVHFEPTTRPCSINVANQDLTPIALRKRALCAPAGFTRSRSAAELLLRQKTELRRLSTICSGKSDTCSHDLFGWSSSPKQTRISVSPFERLATKMLHCRTWPLCSRFTIHHVPRS